MKLDAALHERPGCTGVAAAKGGQDSGQAGGGLDRGRQFITGKSAWPVSAASGEVEVSIPSLSSFFLMWPYGLSQGGKPMYSNISLMLWERAAASRRRPSG